MVALGARRQLKRVQGLRVAVTSTPVAPTRRTPREVADRAARCTSSLASSRVYVGSMATKFFVASQVNLSTAIPIKGLTRNGVLSTTRRFKLGH